MLAKSFSKMRIIGTISATIPKIPSTRKKSHILRHILTGKLYKKSVIYHFVIQKEFGTSNSRNLFITRGNFSTRYSSVTYSMKRRSGISLSNRPIIRYLERRTSVIKDQKTSISSPPDTRSRNPRTKFIP